MSVVKRNTVANVIGTVWGSIIGIVFVPVFLHFLGPEGYGMIGFFTTMTSLFSVLELGIGAAAAQELAKASGGGGEVDQRRVQRLLESLEIVVYCIGAFVALVAVLAAPFIAGKWLNSSAIPKAEIVNAIQIQSLLFCLYFPNSLYAGCLSGQQRQVLNNWVGAVVNTARSAGGGAILWLVSPTLEAFLYWQLLVGVASIVILRVCVWTELPARWRLPRLHIQELVRVKDFAAGVAAGNLFGLFIMYADKLFLSALLPLEDYGYYTIGWTLSVVVMRLALPISTAVGPRLTELIAADDPVGASYLYHRSSQFMAFAVVPVSVSIAFFAHDTLLLWTQNPAIAKAAQWPLTLLCFGNMLNALSFLPYCAQIAHGWTSLSVRTSFFVALGVVPLIYFLATNFGLTGAAFVWPIVNVVYLVVYIPAMHMRIMKGEGIRWIRESFAYPIIATVLMVWGLYAIHGPATSGRSFGNVVTLLSVGVLSLIACGASLSVVRRHVIARVR